MRSVLLVDDEYFIRVRVRKCVEMCIRDSCEIARTPTVIFTQKALPEVQKLADRVILMPAVEEAVSYTHLPAFRLTLG